MKRFEYFIEKNGGIEKIIEELIKSYSFDNEVFIKSRCNSFKGSYPNSKIPKEFFINLYYYF